MKEKIFSEMRRLKFGANYVWDFKQYIGFIEKLNPSEKSGFEECMQDFCDAGLFIAEKNGVVLSYRLTEKGVQEIYGK